MEKFEPVQRNQDAKVEGSEMRTLVAAAVFLGALSAEPAQAQEAGQADVPKAETVQRADPGAYLRSFVNGLKADIKNKGIDKQLENAAFDFLESLADRGKSEIEKAQAELQRHRSKQNE